MTADWEPGRWWRVTYDGPSGIWCETSVEEEARDAHAECPGGGSLQRQYIRTEEEWRDPNAPPTPEPECICYDGNPANYDGPQAECDVHGQPSAAYRKGFEAGQDEAIAASRSSSWDYSPTEGRP